MSGKISFEEGIELLEEIVNKLESGSATLDESFSEYEKGVKLYKQLKQILARGEARIIQLTQSGEEKTDADA